MAWLKILHIVARKHLCFGRLLCSLLFSVVLLNGCDTDPTLYRNEHDDRITIRIGQTQQMVLKFIPEGLTPKDYGWGASNDGVEVDSSGLVTAVSSGRAVIYASANQKNEKYTEVFYIIVPIEQGEIRGLTIRKIVNMRNPKVGPLYADDKEIVLIKGETCTIGVTMDADNPTLNEDEQFMWDTSDQNIVKVQTGFWQYNYPKNHEGALIYASNPGEVLLAARFKDALSNNIRVKVFERTDSFEYIWEMGRDQKPVIQDNTVILEKSNPKLPFRIAYPSGVIGIGSGSGEALNDIATQPKGKYAVIYTIDLGDDKIDGKVNESSLIDFKATSMLPWELIPQSSAEVEYILSVDFRAKQVGKYDGGTKAMQLYAVASVKDAKSGKVLRKLSTKEGYLPAPSIEFLEGAQPDLSFAEFDDSIHADLVQELISDVWRQEKNLSVKFE